MKSFFLLSLEIIFYLSSSTALVITRCPLSLSQTLRIQLFLSLFLNIGQSRTRVSASPPSNAMCIPYLLFRIIISSSNLLSIFRPSQDSSRPSADTLVIITSNPNSMILFHVLSSGSLCQRGACDSRSNILAELINPGFLIF